MIELLDGFNGDVVLAGELGEVVACLDDVGSVLCGDGVWLALVGDKTGESGGVGEGLGGCFAGEGVEGNGGFVMEEVGAWADEDLTAEDFELG